MRLLRMSAVVVVALALTAACSGSTPHRGPSTSHASTPRTVQTALAGPATATASSGATGSSLTAGGSAGPGATSSNAATAGTATRQIVVRPVSASGVPASGWTVREGNATIDCSGGLRSPVSTSADVLYCAPSAASAIACWKAADVSHAYCLLDPRSTVLTRYALQGRRFPPAGPSELEPAPAALDLTSGEQCGIRVGGAAARLAVHPDWVPYYFCGRDDSAAVWAPPMAVDGGVPHGDGPWTVQVGGSDGVGALAAREVATAYFVGTA